MKIKNKVSANLLCTFCALFSTLLLTNCKKADNLELNSSHGKLRQSERFAIAASSVPSDFYNITRALPLGYVKDGSKDYTSYIQTAINKYSKIAFPGFPIMVNDNGLNIPSNRTIYFINGSQLRLKPSSKSSYNILKITNATNIVLQDPYIVGDRYSHIGTSGEFGIGIGIRGSSNIVINRAKVYNCWGDGIYIGRSGTVINKNIKLYRPYCRSNRRDGITIINADGLVIEDAYVGFTDGTAPFCGINIEPNDFNDEVKNIRIINLTTEGNKGNGFQMGLGNLYGKGDKYVSVSLENHIDKRSGCAVKTSCRLGRRVGSEIISGTFYIKGANWQKNVIKPLSAYFPETNMKLSITQPTVMDNSGTYLTTLQAKALLTDDRAIWSPTIYNVSF